MVGGTNIGISAGVKGRKAHQATANTSTPPMLAASMVARCQELVRSVMTMVAHDARYALLIASEDQPPAPLASTEFNAHHGMPEIGAGDQAQGVVIAAALARRVEFERFASGARCAQFIDRFQF